MGECLAMNPLRDSLQGALRRCNARTVWDELLLGVLPFLILIVFWIFLMRAGTRWRNDPLVEKLDEIRQELQGLRRALEQRERV